MLGDRTWVLSRRADSQQRHAPRKANTTSAHLFCARVAALAHRECGERRIARIRAACSVRERATGAPCAVVEGDASRFGGCCAVRGPTNCRWQCAVAPVHRPTKRLGGCRHTRTTTTIAQHDLSQSVNRSMQHPSAALRARASHTHTHAHAHTDALHISIVWRMATERINDVRLGRNSSVVVAEILARPLCPFVSAVFFRASRNRPRDNNVALEWAHVIDVARIGWRR